MHVRCPAGCVCVVRRAFASQETICHQVVFAHFKDKKKINYSPMVARLNEEGITFIIGKSGAPRPRSWPSAPRTRWASTPAFAWLVGGGEPSAGGWPRSNRVCYVCTRFAAAASPAHRRRFREHRAAGRCLLRAVPDQTNTTQAP